MRRSGTMMTPLSRMVAADRRGLWARARRGATHRSSGSARGRPPPPRPHRRRQRPRGCAERVGTAARLLRCSWGGPSIRCCVDVTAASCEDEAMFHVEHGDGGRRSQALFIAATPFEEARCEEALDARRRPPLSGGGSHHAATGVRPEVGDSIPLTSDAHLHLHPAGRPDGHDRGASGVGGEDARDSDRASRTGHAAAAAAR